jgi:branched-subunit amino acid ABC-type transport system permease component
MISTIIYGLTIGGILYLTSIGLSLTFGTMKIVNFAHFIIYTVGAYVLVVVLSMFKNSFFLGIVIATLAVIPLSYIIERYVIRKLYGKSVDYAIVATYAIMLIGVDVIKWIWGAQPIPLGDPIGEMVILFSAEFPLYRLIIILISLGVFFVLEQFFQNNIIGKVITAGVEDGEAVRSLGIKLDKYFSFAFILGSCLAALGGGLYAAITSVNPYMGFQILGLSFAVVIAGGLGNLRGTFFSAIILGLVMAITGRFWGPAADTMVYLVMIIALITRREVEMNT